MTTQRSAPKPTEDTERRERWSAAAAVGVTVLAWASAFVAIRMVGPSIGPGPLALGRLLIGSAALGAVLLVRGGWVRPTRKEWALAAVCGLSWFAVYNVALNAAELRVDAGTTAMLVNIGPILIAVLAGVLLGEGFPRRLLAGVAVAFAGVLLIGAATVGEAPADAVGVALCLLAACTYAIGVLSQKPVLRRIPAVQVTWLACTIGAVACLPYAPALVADVGAAPAGAVGGLVYLGLVPTALAFGTWAYALSRIDAGRLGVSTYLVPPITVAMAWPLTGEAPALAALAGGAVCLAGVALSRSRPGAKGRARRRT
ncbi:drug/metabolite transporter (DMT)-like permease [Murinocardiopsis flavida]|uniref:Drug/metabolite transporter (DMT)-like permease n=1 Tax=Murinocardiopsis flavida TaxID=645275 RepID=A0A2P8DU17_9ACTN|nr:DMT family transporter [Murinocardiopsis flavida]PSL00717.1 drug/metabolite transporter (DMT)-like permease [Murinocardiopsis flavida]